MPDIATITAALNALRTATDIAKGIRQADISLEKAEHKYQLADLISALADAKIAISSIQEDVIDKDRQIRELQATINLKKEMTYIDPFYWQVKGETHDGPFCQQCYDANGKAIRVSFYDTNDWFCKTCGQSYFVHEHVRSKQPKVLRRL